MPFAPLPGLFQGLVAATLITLFAAPLQARQYDANGYSFAVEPVPAWVDWTGLPETYEERPGLAAAYRLVDRQHNITENGTTRFSRLVTQPLTEAGLNQAAEIEIEFNPAFQKLRLHKLSVIRNGRITDKLQPEQVHLIQREQDFEKKLYDGIVTAVIIVKDVRLKDSVDLAYSIEGRNPVFGKKYFSTFALGWNVPVDLARIRVSAPAKRKLHTRSFNTSVKPDIHRNNGRIEYEWSQSNTAAVISEDSAPSWHQPYPGVQISEYRHWRDVTAWADSLYTLDSTLPPALNKTLQQWREEEHDKKRLTARALKLVQDEIRYFGIELGQNSHRPSLAADVYERRYGDCKDKAALLVTMLDKLGIKAYPALVSTEYQREIDNWLPSPGLFDHVIVTTELDGKRYWLDGTRNYQRGSIDTLGVPDFERALIVRKKENRLTPIEIRESATSGIDIEEEFVTTDFGAPVKLNVKTTYKGAAAESMREYFATNTPAEISRSYMNYYAKFYPLIDIGRNVESIDVPGENIFTVSEYYRVEDFWKTEDETKYASLLGYTIAPYITKPKTIRRTAPLAVEHPINIRHTSTIIYPEDIDYEIEEPSVAIEGRFMGYQRAVSYDSRKLTVTHNFSSRKEAVMPAQLDNYFDDINKISDQLEYTTTLSDVMPQTNIGGRINTLLDRLDKLSSN
jgi:transglutaminase-like putative cysteine protease